MKRTRNVLDERLTFLVRSGYSWLSADAGNSFIMCTSHECSQRVYFILHESFVEFSMSYLHVQYICFGDRFSPTGDMYFVFSESRKVTPY